MQKFIVLCALALCAFASALPSDFQNDVILGRRATLAAASPCSCLSSKCTTVAPANGGVGTCKSEYKTTETCSTFTCNTGWQATAKTTSGTCTNGLFSFTACKGEPCKLVAKDVTPSGGTAGSCSDNSAWASGQHCVPKCKKGYVYSGKVQCTAKKITTGKCVPATCDFSAAITNGSPNDCTATMTPTSSKAATCTPKCNDGYKVHTGSKYTCTYPSVAGGPATKSGTTVTCTPKTCDASALIANAASVPAACSKTLASGSSACTQVGKQDYRCTASSCLNGKLTPGVCSPIDCKASVAAKVTGNLIVDTCSTTKQLKGPCKMKCKPGFAVSNPTLTCQQTTADNRQGTVTGSPTCAATKCPAADLKAALTSTDGSITGLSGSKPSGVTGGSWGNGFTGTGSPHTATATPQCKDNTYTMVAKATCQTDSTWSKAKCEKNCDLSTLSLPSNAVGATVPSPAPAGVQTKCVKGGSNNLKGGQRCFFACNTGTCGNGKCSNFPNGDKTTGKCVDGKLVQPKCILNTCDFSTAPTDGDVGKCTKTVAAGAECVPTCDKGFTLTGKSKCASNGASKTSTATCVADKCKISSVLNAATPSSPTGTCTHGGDSVTGGISDTKGCKITGCATDFYMPAGLSVECNDGKMTCVGCDSTCKPGQNCRGSGAAHCTACRSGWVSKNKKNDGTRTCAVPSSWTKTDHMHVTQTVYFEAAFGIKANSKSLDHSASNKAKYQGCYAYALGGSTAGVAKASCQSGITSHALPKELTVSVSKASRRGRVTANFIAKYLCPKPVQAACRAKAEAVGKQAYKLTKALLQTNFAYANLAQVEAVLEAKASVTSSASSTSIMAMSSVVAMLAGLFWQ